MWPRPTRARRAATRSRRRRASVVTVGAERRGTAGRTAIRPGKGGGDPRAVALAAWAHGSVAGRKLPHPSDGAGVIARFFATLTAAQRTRLADRYPLVVGNLNGAPV